MSIAREGCLWFWFGRAVLCPVFSRQRFHDGLMELVGAGTSRLKTFTEQFKVQSEYPRMLDITSQSANIRYVLAHKRQEVALDFLGLLASIMACMVSLIN